MQKRKEYNMPQLSQTTNAASSFMNNDVSEPQAPNLPKCFYCGAPVITSCPALEPLAPPADYLAAAGSPIPNLFCQTCGGRAYSTESHATSSTSYSPPLSDDPPSTGRYYGFSVVNQLQIYSGTSFQDHSPPNSLLGPQTHAHLCTSPSGEGLQTHSSEYQRTASSENDKERGTNFTANPPQNIGAFQFNCASTNMAESRNEPSGEDPSVPITQGDDRRQPEAEQQSSETSDVGQDQRPPIPPATQGEALVGQRATAVGGNWNPPAGSHQTGASDGSTVYPSYNDPAYRAHFPLAGNNLAAGGSFPEAVNSVNNTPSAQQPFSDPIAFQRSWDEYIRREYARRLAFARAYQVPLASVRAAPNTGPNFHAGHMAPSTTGLPIPNHPPLTSIMIDTDRIPIPVVNPTAGGPQMAQGFPAHANFIAPDSNQNRARRRRHSEAFAMNDSQHEDTSVYPSTSRRVRTTAQRAFAAEEARLVPNAAADPFLNPQTINHHALAALAARVRGRTASTEYRRRVLGDSRPVKSLDCGNDGRPKPKDRSEMKVDFECKVCLSQKVDTVIIPCGHAVLCQWCAEQQIPSHPCFPSRPREAVTCPVCRKPVREKFRIYTP